MVYLYLLLIHRTHTHTSATETIKMKKRPKPKLPSENVLIELLKPLNTVSHTHTHTLHTAHSKDGTNAIHLYDKSAANK